MNDALLHIYQRYSTDSNGIINDHSKFSFQPIYVPYFWEYIKLGYHQNGKITLEIEDKQLFVSAFPRLSNAKIIQLKELKGKIGHKLIY